MDYRNFGQRKRVLIVVESKPKGARCSCCSFDEFGCAIARDHSYFEFPAAQIGWLDRWESKKTMSKNDRGVNKELGRPACKFVGYLSVWY